MKETFLASLQTQSLTGPAAPAFADCIPAHSGRFHPPQPRKNINNFIFCFSSIYMKNLSPPRLPPPGTYGIMRIITSVVVLVNGSCHATGRRVVEYMQPQRCRDATPSV